MLGPQGLASLAGTSTLLAQSSKSLGVPLMMG